MPLNKNVLSLALKPILLLGSTTAFKVSMMPQPSTTFPMINNDIAKSFANTFSLQALPLANAFLGCMMSGIVTIVKGQGDKSGTVVPLVPFKPDDIAPTIDMGFKTGMRLSYFKALNTNIPPNYTQQQKINLFIKSFNSIINTFTLALATALTTGLKTSGFTKVTPTSFMDGFEEVIKECFRVAFIKVDNYKVKVPLMMPTETSIIFGLEFCKCSDDLAETFIKIMKKDLINTSIGLLGKIK